MQYPFENLGPERFQEFCQALLLREHPNVQCYPVAQPDGGRDAVRLDFGTGSGFGFAVFQVKFVRNPSNQLEPHKWLSEIIDDEAPKIAKLIPKGAQFFTLLTNVAGTAHLDAGSIDIVAKMLTEKLGIPSKCLWRDDLSRRLDGQWDLKWTYPDLMTGADILRLVMESGAAENSARRELAVRTFVTAQYRNDSILKFKQVELSNRLLSLFVDVPARESGGPNWGPSSNRARERPPVGYIIRALMADRDTDVFDDPEIRGSPASVGAAKLLLSRLSEYAGSFFVIQGAPGQGKSTITQYICQVHRMRLLGKTLDLRIVPDNHKASPLRLPVRVDLRDFATWLSRKNPFAPEPDTVPTSIWEKSLESFIAALVANESGGARFDVSDLHAIAKH